MKLWILSDLHADHPVMLPEPPEGAEVAVLAGDILDDDWLVEIARRLPTVFVAGNHEFYRFSYPERVAQLKALEGVQVLDNDSVQIGNICFLGATLWTDYDRSQRAMDVARRSMNDHRLIKWRKDPWERFEPKHAAKLHAESRAYIENTLAQHHDGPTVVLTHHAPHPNSIDSRYASDPLNHAYASNLDTVIENGRPSLWIHGHVHSRSDYQVFQTRVVCNPRGYPGEITGYDPQLLIEI